MKPLSERVYNAVATLSENGKLTFTHQKLTSLMREISAASEDEIENEVRNQLKQFLNIGVLQNAKKRKPTSLIGQLNLIKLDYFDEHIDAVGQRINDLSMAQPTAEDDEEDIETSPPKSKRGRKGPKLDTVVKSQVLFKRGRKAPQSSSNTVPDQEESVEEPSPVFQKKKSSSKKSTSTKSSRSRGRSKNPEPIMEEPESPPKQVEIHESRNEQHDMRRGKSKPVPPAFVGNTKKPAKGSRRQQQIERPRSKKAKRRVEEKQRRDSGEGTASPTGKPKRAVRSRRARK